MLDIGIDYLLAAGNKHGDYITAMCRNHPKGFGAGFLFKVSGCKHGAKAANALAKTGKLDGAFCRCHGLWHDTHRFTKKSIKPAVKQAERLAVLVERYPNIKWFYSPWLEPVCSFSLMKECLRACRKVLPRKVRLVSGVYTYDRLTETHGDVFNWTSRYIYSFDGSDMFERDAAFYLRMHKGAKFKMGWTARCNLKMYASQAKPRQDRVAWLRKQDIEKMERILRRSK